MSQDYIYNRHAVELDSRLEKVMTSHETMPKQATDEDPSSGGLQAFVERQTIAEEIASLPKVAIDLNVELGRAKVASIVEERTGRFDAFLATTAPAVESVKTAAAQRETITNHLETLRGSVTPERS